MHTVPSSYIGSEACAKDVSPTEGVLNSLADEQAKTGHLIEHLSTKLAAIRGGLNEAGASKNEPNPIYATPLLRAIDERLDRQRAINAQLSSLMNDVVI